MESQYPLGAKRLHALLGDKMHSFPPHFIEKLERTLEEHEREQIARSRTVHLKLVPDVADDAPLLGADAYIDLKRHSKVAIPLRTLQGLASIFEILHAVHLAKQDGDPEGVLSEHLVEGLIVSGRAMVKSASDTTCKST